MKRVLMFVLALLAALSLTGCGEYRAPTGGSSAEQPGDAPAVEEEEGDFKVRLTVNGAPYVPSEQIEAIWTNDLGGKFSAAFNRRGVASVTGPDGEYRITLSAPPSGFTYNPNIYYASNDEKDVSVTLYPLRTAMGSGSDFSHMAELPRTGAYRAVLRSPQDKYFFKYKPTVGGVYTVESMIDVTANVINPILDKYIDNPALESLQLTVDDGGASSTYTKNFRRDFNEPNAGGGNTFIFCIRTESINADAFPVNLDFVIFWEGENETEEDPLKYPTEDFKNRTEYAAPQGATIVKAADDPRHAPATLQWKTTAQNGETVELYKLNPADGYYYRYVNGAYEKRLYAYITRDSYVDYGGMGFLHSMLRLNCNGYNYSPFFKEVDADGIAVTDARGMFIPQGYAKYANSDGAYPVTEELKEFLQAYASARQFFFDGAGTLENSLSSGEEDQWLYDCFYYV